MKRRNWLRAGLALSLLAGFFGLGIGMIRAGAQAAPAAGNKINHGIYIDDVDVSDLSAAEAEQAVSRYVTALMGKQITLLAAEGNSVTVTAGELGLSWENQDVIEDALQLGKKGNVVQRYKALRDLEHKNKVFPLKFTFQDEAIRSVIEKQCIPFNIPAEDASLIKTDSGFEVTGGQTGIKISVDESVIKVKDYMTGFWNKEETMIDLVADVDEPRGNPEDLAKVKDLLGTFSTSYSSSGKARSANVTNGTKLINATLLYPGDVFSAYEVVTPFTEENGYYMAGSYLNGMIVDSLGGGICQVTSTLYNAVLQAELEVVERFPHSMTVSYVDFSADAAIAGTYKDFKFKNNLEVPVYIEGYTTDSKNVVFNIYGMETRDKARRKVRYESKTISVTEPAGEKIVPSTSMAVGSVSVQAAHKGIAAELYKIVEEDGVEVSRTRVNKSNYSMVPRTATVGIASPDPNITAMMQAAIATGSIDHCKGVAASLQAAAAAASQLPVPGLPDPQNPQEPLPPPVITENDLVPID